MNPDADLKHTQIREEQQNRNRNNAQHRTQKDLSQSFSQAECWSGLCHETPIISPLLPTRNGTCGCRRDSCRRVVVGVWFDNSALDRQTTAFAGNQIGRSSADGLLPQSPPGRIFEFQLRPWP